MATRPLVYLGTLVAVLFVSFFVTLWLTEEEKSPAPSDARSNAERLANQRIVNSSELRRIADDLGLKLARQMQGNIDVFNRLNEREVMISGWLADPDGDVAPQDLIVFVAGSVVARTRTAGERPDVTRALGLGFGTERNVGFGVSFSCRTGDQPVVVGIGTGNQYLLLTSGPCP